MTHHHDAPERHIESRLIDRLLFFSDAVFAIVLTLLVIELHPPHLPPGSPEFYEELQTTLTHVVFFAMSFGLVAIFWAAHMSLLRRLQMFDWAVAWINLAFLFTITLMPFGTSMLMAQGITQISWQIYSSILIGASLGQTLLWLFVSRGGGRLMGGVDWRELLLRTLRGLAPGIAFVAGFYAAYIGRLDLAVWCGALIVPMMLVFRAVLGEGRASG
ncbi:MAG: TMEM175 family protein [Alphaproteobacteria bacterium]|nr:TMEM175 family protein [Alphaproteobacteria bacterium]